LVWLLPAAALAASPSIDHAIQLHTAGRLKEALREYHATAKAMGASDPAVVGTALNNACVIQMNLGEYREALPDCREALRLSRGAGDSEALAQALNNLGWVLQGLGETTEAERDFREALEVNRKRGDPEGQAINLSNLGSLAIATGRYSAALDLHAQAEVLASRYRGEAWAAGQAWIARLNQGVVLEKVGAYREALDLYRGLLAARGEPDLDRRASLLVNTGVIYRNLGDPVRAEATFREGIEAWRRVGDTAALSNAWLNLALAEHLNLEHPAGAEAAYREALRLAEESGDRTEEVQDLFYLGRLLLESGRFGDAEATFRRCLAAAEASGSAEGKWSARAGLGRIARARGDLRGGFDHFEHALEEIERVRSAIARPRRAGYFGDKRAVYAATVDTLGELDRREPGKGWGERALEVAQRAKARDLLDVLGAGGQPPAPPLGAAALRSRVREGAVLEYFLGEKDLFLWVIRRGDVRFRDLGASRPILDAVASVHRALSHGEAPPAAVVAGLSRRLLGPAGALPQGDEPLRIAPDGALRHLPFELLEDPRRSGAPLVEGSTVSYLLSASMLATLAGQSRKAVSTGGRLLGIGDPRLTRSGDGPRSPRDLLVERFGLAPLAAAGREIGMAARLLGGRSVEIHGDQATERAFRDAVAGGARVVHFATHTVIDERPGRGAAILLAPSDDDDGLLTPEEIARLDDRSALTVLAACRTALGPGEDGQALASLTGSFLAAGSQSVVATLWDVGDASTAAFMQQFYWQLGEGQTPAEALRAAKRHLRADPRWRHPDLWAGYVLVGDAPAVVPRKIPWVLWGALIVAAILGATALEKILGQRPARVS
jgi:tetratricopeptide (TPR) repeat protein